MTERAPNGGWRKSYREIPENRVLRFSGTPGFKGWKDFFSNESVAHPAKMNLKLLRHILEVYTSPGDVVLDPMAGTGSTIILASLLGRDGIAVEYEPQFCDMIRSNIKRVERQATLTPKGRMLCAHGAARELSNLLKESDAIITSPPYSESIKEGNIGLVGAIEKASGISRKVFLNDREKLKEAINIAQEKRPFRYSNDLQNIGNLKHGDIEAIITSPPYSEMISSGEGPLAVKAPHATRGHLMQRNYSESPDNIGNLPHGNIEAIITSPPYGSDNANLLEREDKSAKSILSTTGVKAISLEEENIGVLEYGDVDAVITSPPYEASVKRGDEGPGASGKDSPTYDERLEQPNVYSNDPDNIGNLKSESYLEAMLQCYREYYKVLREGGVMVLVTKNFIRNKAVVRLDLDTISLAEYAGFTLKDRWYFKLPTKSFWRIVYAKKYPDVPEIDYEDVLVFKKESEK